MMNVKSGNDGAMFSVNASLTGMAIYLDHFAIMEFAEGDITRSHRRKVASRHCGTRLLRIRGF
jgi:hypothetical protein